MSNIDLVKSYEKFHIQIMVEGTEKLIFFPSGYDFDENGNKIYCGFIAIPPAEDIITLSAPFDCDSLKDALERAMLQVDKYERYRGYEQRKLPWEAKYYKTRGFRSAIKGEYEISVRSLHYYDENPIAIDYFWPCRGSYQLYGLSANEIDRSEGMTGTAKMVLQLLETDITETKQFKIAKHFLLLP